VLTEIRLRPVQEDDYGFIFVNWLGTMQGALRKDPDAIAWNPATLATLESLRNTAFFDPRAERVLDAFYRDHEHGFIEHQLTMPEHFVVACDPLDESILFGFGCGSRDVMHMLFVKNQFRRYGVAQAMYDKLTGGKPAMQFSRRTERGSAFLAGQR
jgi:hypothetical protein